MGGGSSAPATPSTTTQVQDIPEWEQGYVTNLLGQAQTLAAQPYQQYSGPQVAGFTDDQNQAFSNIENMGSSYQPTANAALASATAGANTANGIYNAGAGNINASTGYNPLEAVSPYLNSAATYNSASAAQPWLNQAAGYTSAAANAATPEGIQSYMSPYTNDVVNGIQNEANQNWSQNIMPGVNDKFVGSGQYGSGRNAQVLGQAAGNFQTGLSANVANALESGYTTAGNQAATQAGILGNLANTSLTGANDASGAQTSQISNLLNQAQSAGTATNQQAQNLQSAGTALGNLTATQGAQQTAAGTALGNLSNQQEQEGLTQNQALQAVGQQQQQLNQTNLNTAMSNFQNQVNYPEQQTEYLNQIIRGLPASSATTSSSQTTPAYSVSPLSGIGGAGTGALSVLGANGSQVGSVQGAARGGLIKGYASGGVVTAEDDEDSMNPLNNVPDDDSSPLSLLENDSSVVPADDSIDQADLPAPQTAPNPIDADQLAAQDQPDPTKLSMNPIDTSDLDTPDSQNNSEAPDGKQYKGLTKADMQQQQLLAMARGLLTPSPSGSPWASLGQGFGAAQDVGLQLQKINAEQQERNDRLKIEQQNADSLKDFRDWKQTNTGVGANDTMAKALMADNPDLTYTQAIKMVLSKDIQDKGSLKNLETVKPSQSKNGVTSPSANGQIPMSDLVNKPNKGGNDGDLLAEVAPDGVTPAKSDGPITGDAYLATLPADRAGLAKAIATGDQKYPTAYAMSKSPTLMQAVADARRYDPDTNERRYGNLQKFETGALGNQVSYLNSSVAHLSTAQELADALNNGDTPIINKVANKYAQETGSDAPNNFDLAKQIVATETMKAISNANAGGQAERDELQGRFNSANSPQQLKGAIHTAQKMLSGQIDTKRIQYEDSTGRKDFITRKLSPATQNIYSTYFLKNGTTQGESNSSNADSGAKMVSQSDIEATAKKYNKTVDQVTQDAKSKGYSIQ